MLCPNCFGEGCERCEGRGNVPAQPNVLVERILARLVATPQAPAVVPVLTPAPVCPVCGGSGHIFAVRWFPCPACGGSGVSTREQS